MPSLRRVHEVLASVEYGAVLAQLQIAAANTTLGDEAKDEARVQLRSRLMEVVQSARLVERWPDNDSSWVRVEVEWAPAVQTLLDAGGLVLDPAPRRPPLDPRVERRRARKRRAYHDRKARQQAEQAAQEEAATA